MRGAFWLAAALLAAGCLQEGPAGAQAAGSGAAHGVLHGFVVSSAIVPVAGADVTVQPGRLQGATDADGRFRFEGLEPGAYLVAASRDGFLPSQVQAQVLSGDADPLPVQVVLQPDPLGARFVESYSFEGFLELSGALGPASFGGSGILSNGTFAISYDLGPSLPDWVQAEMVWEPTQALGSTMLLTATPQNGSVQTISAESEGPSPLLLPVEPELLEEWGLRPGDPLTFVAYAGDYTTSPAGGIGMAFQQDFTLFTHLFYGFRPAEGWRFTEEGPP